MWNFRWGWVSCTKKPSFISSLKMLQNGRATKRDIFPPPPPHSPWQNHGNKKTFQTTSCQRQFLFKNMLADYLLLWEGWRIWGIRTNRPLLNHVTCPSHGHLSIVYYSVVVDSISNLTREVCRLSARQSDLWFHVEVSFLATSWLSWWGKQDIVLR